jgi:hypothetical protein
VLAATAGPCRAASVVDYLYLEANEGGSSGGHVAIGFGDRVYDFQRRPSGVLSLERDDARHFAVRHAGLQNRPIHRIRVAVSDETYGLLRDAFNTRHLIEERQRDLAAGLHADRELLAALGRPPGAGGGFAVSGAGFFAADGAEPDAPAAAARRGLPARVAAAYGAGYVARRIAALRDDLARLDPAAFALPPPRVVPDVYPAAGDGFAVRYRELLSELTALEVLRDAPALRPDAVVAADDATFALASAERDGLSAFAGDLAAQLVRLVGSRRPDRGEALLAGMARLDALERSVATGRLVVLDAFAADAPRLPARVLRDRPAAARILVDEAEEDLATTRHALVESAPLDEPAYARIETAANRLVELRRGVEHGGTVRTAEGLLVPSRPAERPLVRSALPDAALAAAFGAVDAASTAYDAALTDAYRYDLVRRNCVSEVFRTIDCALASGDGESRLRLGGRIDADGALAVVPFVSALAVDRTYRVASRDDIGSYRELRAAELAAREGSLWVRLRESNTLTSTIYRYSPDDSLFLFFTDDALAVRPVLGAANLAVGIGGSVAGLVALPVDRGATLLAGLRGVLYSVPELVFANIRKGTFDGVERRYWPAGS